MSTLTELAERLKSGGEYVIYPKAMGDVPIKLPKMIKYGETGTAIGHYSINELSHELGRILVPLPLTESKSHYFIRWSFDKNTTASITDEQATRKMMNHYGLVEICNLSELTINDIKPNNYGIFGAYEFTKFLKRLT